MAIQNAISEYRNVKIAFDNAAGADIVDQDAQIAAPLDAFKAAIGIVTRLEGEYAKNPDAVADLSAASILATGNLPFQIHSFEVTTDMAAGSYIFLYVETKPNTDA